MSSLNFTNWNTTQPSGDYFPANVHVGYTAWFAALVAFATFLVWEQVVYKQKKAHLPGPEYTIPVVGALLDSLNPSFDAYLSKWNSGPLSVVSVFQRFIVIASSCDISRKIFSSPGNFEPCMVDSMRKILEPDNWVFTAGKAHVEYRKSLNALFTKKALSIYLKQQEMVLKKHIAKWIALGEKPRPYQYQFRELNMESSLSVFCGSYISGAAIEEVSRRYYCITAALELVNFPWAFPGTKVWHAIQARKYIVRVFMDCARQSRERMEKQEPITCLMDAWIQAMLDEAQSEKERARVFDEREIALTTLTFLFASQDATTSGLTWCFQLLADHPDVMEKIVAEQISMREKFPEYRDGTLTFELFEDMTYTRQVVREVLRLRPPVLMVPHQAKKDVSITTDYNVPNGAMIIPTTWPALHDPEVYPKPDEFNPDRFAPGSGVELNSKNYLVFGCGPHVCIGKEYAIMHMMAVVALAACHMEWKHFKTPDSDKIVIFATTYPADQCILQVKPRELPCN